MLAPIIVGFATGLRSTAGLVAITRSSRLGRLALVAGLGELVADQLPTAPSRLEPAGLVARLAVGGLSGAVLGAGSGRPRAAVIGSLSALAGSYAGSRWRVVAARRFRGDRPGSLIEDGVTAALVWIGSARR